MQKTILLLKRALGIPYVNRIDFFAFCVYKNVSQKKKVFVYEWKLQWLPSEKDNVHNLYIQKAKTLQNPFIYKKPDTLQKARQFSLRFYIQKARHFTLRDFSWKFEAVLYIQKSWHFALGDVFVYKKLDTSKKAS